MSARRTAISVTALLGASLATQALGPTRVEPEIAPLPPLATYAKRATLQRTLLDTRDALQRWQLEQSAARACVTLGPWHATATLSFDAQSPSADLAANAPNGKPLWMDRPGWKDGQFIPLTPAGQGHPAASMGITRTITASKPVALAIGIGGGDTSEIWLNGQRTHDLDTRLRFERYGTGEATDQILNDQFIVDLQLHQGENRLLIRIAQRQIDHRRHFRLWFRHAPNPVPHLWKHVRHDFPPHENRLLEAVPHTWFETPGWLAATDAPPERDFLVSTFERNAPLAQSLRPCLADLDAAKAPPNDPRWLNLCVGAAEAERALSDLKKLRTAIDELGRGFPAQYPADALARQTDGLHKAILDAAGALDPANEATRSLLADVERLKRAALVTANPLLKDQRLLFVRRYTYDSAHYYDDYYNGIRDWGGNICELDLASGKVREIVPQLSGGIFDRYDLSRDARRLIFGYRARRPEGFRIWEIGLNGKGLRQLTFPPKDEAARVARHHEYPMDLIAKDPRYYGHWTDDMHPCYLPDGRIAFVSTRAERTVLCGGHTLTTTALHRIDAGGGNPQEVSQGALSEFTPAMLADGRILYNRWEYVYKGIAAIQPLWAIRPDGTGSEEIYGDNIDNPGVFLGGHQVPGKPNLIVATGCGHEPLAVGSIRLIDLHKDKRTKDAMVSLTPEVETRGLRGLYQFRNGRWNEHDLYGPFYCDPYPLADPKTGAGAGKFFLVSCNPHARYNDKRAYGIYLIDTFGNRVPVYQDPEFSCWQAMPLAPRPRPPVLSPASVASAKPCDAPEATVLVTDVYRGLDGIKPGAVKYLRVMEQIPRSWVASQIQPGDAVRGQNPAISLHTHIWIAVLLGIVPVEADGSACFKLPADRNIFLHALDENFMEIQKMRTFVNFQPGETRSCIGCHEHRNQAPVPRHPIALNTPPRAIAPQPGDTGPRPIHYPADVQPVLDRHCVSCHGGAEPKAKLDLAGTPTETFSISYENLLRKGLVNFIQEWTGPDPDKGGPSYVSNGSMMHAEAVPPYTYGSHKSKLLDVLRKGHHDVKLSREEFVRLVTWVDVNAPFYGSYFGRRHIAAKGRPDFRPTPTLASARGVPPEPAVVSPIPAELLAWWKLVDAAKGLVADASGHGRDAQAVGNPPRFDGATYLQSGQIGKQEAISVAMWVRPDTLNNRWNPLLFTDGADASSFHFSVLDNGAPNVAINTGGKQWAHSRANSSLATGRWQHLAVVCDPRYGGTIRFYINGQPAGASPLDLGVPLDLSAFRVGAWKTWEGTPANNFHGSLRDIRIYRGSLSASDIRDLARQQPTETHSPQITQVTP